MYFLSYMIYHVVIYLIKFIVASGCDIIVLRIIRAFLVSQFFLAEKVHSLSTEMQIALLHVSVSISYLHVGVGSVTYGYPTPLKSVYV